jgi:hypothetical protein
MTTPVVGLTGGGTDSIESIGFILYNSTRCYTEYRNCPGSHIADELAYWCYNPENSLQGYCCYSGNKN